MLASILTTILLAGSIGAPIYEETSFEVPETTITKRNLTISEGTFTLTAEEMNGHAFTHLADYLNENYDALNSYLFSTHVNQNNNVYECDDYVKDDCISWGPISTDYLFLRLEPSTEEFGHWYLVGETDAPVTSDYPFIFDFSGLLANDFEAITNAIEADLTPPTITANIFDVISDTINGVINNLTTAITGCTQFFWNAEEGKLTTIGTLSAVIVGGSVVYFVFRLIRKMIGGGARAQM